MKKAVLVFALILVVTGAVAIFIYGRAADVAESARATAVEELAHDTLSVAGLAASFVGSQIVADLELTPDQEERIRRIYTEHAAAPISDADASDSVANPTRDALHAELGRLREQAIRESVRAVLSEQQWERIERSSAGVVATAPDVRRYARTPLAQNLADQLDLSDDQISALNALAQGYAKRASRLMATSDETARRALVRSLFDKAWSDARQVLSREQQGIVERYLVTHRTEIEAGLRGLWLSGL